MVATPPSIEVHAATMNALVSLFTWCCQKPRKGSDSDDESDWLPVAAVGEAPSLRSRIKKYQAATQASTYTGNWRNHNHNAHNHNKERSTSSVIAQFETMIVAGSSSEEETHSLTTRTSLSTRSSMNNLETTNGHTSKPLCTVCQQPIWPYDATVRCSGHTLHASCFSCRKCSAKLTHHPGELQEFVPAGQYPIGDSENPPSLSASSSSSSDSSLSTNSSKSITYLYLECSKCQEVIKHQNKPKVLATVAGAKILPHQSELGDVQGVHEAIGDELEDILVEKTLPRCHICGGDFLGSTRVTILGQTKYHPECFERGRPSFPCDPSLTRRLTPSQASKYVPERWIVRVFLPRAHGGRNEILATLFFVWDTKTSDRKRFRSEAAAQKNYYLPVRAILSADSTAAPGRPVPLLSPTRKSPVAAKNDDEGTTDHEESSDSEVEEWEANEATTAVDLLAQARTIGARLECELVGNPLGSLLVLRPTTISSVDHNRQYDVPHDTVTKKEDVVGVPIARINEGEADVDEPDTKTGAEQDDDLEGFVDEERAHLNQEETYELKLTPSPLHDESERDDEADTNEKDDCHEETLPVKGEEEHENDKEVDAASSKSDLFDDESKELICVLRMVGVKFHVEHQLSLQIPIVMEQKTHSTSTKSFPALDLARAKLMIDLVQA